MADEAEEDADQEEDGGAVEPGAQLQGARYGIADVYVPQEWDPTMAARVPPYFVSPLGREAREDEERQDLH